MSRSKWERRAQKELETDGYFVDWKVAPRFPIKGYVRDYFHLFDLLAYKKNEPLRWIAIKPAMNGNVPILRKSIELFKMHPSNSKELWRYDRDPKNRTRIRVRKEIIS